MLGRGITTVLVIEPIGSGDEIDHSFLRRDDIRVIRSDAAAGVVGLAAREHPGVAILDADSDCHGGLEACRELKADRRTRGIPVVAIVGDGAAGEADRSGADAVVSKPVASGALLDAVRRFVPIRGRRHPRARVNVRFEIAYRGHGGQAFSRELSPGGAFLRTDRSPEIGSIIALRFRLPGDPRQMKCDGIVRSGTPGIRAGFGLTGFGVEFRGLPDDDRDRLDRFVRHCLGSRKCI